MDLSFRAWHLSIVLILFVAVACSTTARSLETNAFSEQGTPFNSPPADQTFSPAVSSPELDQRLGSADGTDLSLNKSPDNISDLRTPTDPPPKVDISLSTVSVDDVVFDTFRGGFIRLSEADDGSIENLRDRIKPVYEPIYDPAPDGDWMGNGDLVVGYVGKNSGQAFAYPVKMLNLHEIVNDVIDGRPVLISYCPLCASGAVYDRRLNGEVLLFGNTSALYQSDLVMYDHQTGSYWFQVLGEAIVGPLSGQRLKLLPAVTTEWGQWKELYPNTQVLSKDQGLLGGGFGNPYDRDSFEGYQEIVNSGRFAFPVDETKLDHRLSPGELVLSVQVEDSHKAYPMTGSPDVAINDDVGGRSLVVLIREGGPSGFAYFADVDGRILSFSLANGVLVDDQTMSVWNDTGKSVSGELQGTRLQAVPARSSYWFSLAGSLPDIELHTSE